MSYVPHNLIATTYFHWFGSNLFVALGLICFTGSIPVGSDVLSRMGVRF